MGRPVNNKRTEATIPPRTRYLSGFTMFELSCTRCRSVVLLAAPKGFAVSILTLHPPTLRRICTGFYVRACRQRLEFGPGGEKRKWPRSIGCRRRNRKNGPHPMITNDPPRRDARGRYARDVNGALTFLPLGLADWLFKNFMREVGLGN